MITKNALSLRSPATYCIAAGVLLGLLAWAIWHNPHYLAAILPYSFAPYALYFANLFPIAVLTLIPGTILLAKSPWQKARIVLLTIILFGVSLIPTIRLVQGSPAEPTTTEYFHDGTCRQTSADTCSAAATVTLLKQYGIVTTEQKIASLARTKVNRGTHPLGIYRALTLTLDKTTSTLKATYTSMDARTVLAASQPALVNVGLLHQPITSLEHDLVQKYQWTPGVVHSVVFLGTAKGKVQIADPDFGIENWSEDGFIALYRGTVFMLN